ncbi:response regulator receiver protein [Stanieria sp. NIES-3757]|nr:response regulator receiver protein [Stanieria sp. NIES-3757]
MLRLWLFYNRLEAKLNNGAMATMNSDQTPSIVSIEEFVASKQIRLFQGLKQNGYSGQLIVRDEQQQEWIFYLYWGRIVYVTGGIHPVRRWRRHLAVNFPNLAHQLSEELKYFEESKTKEIEITWDYNLLEFWVETGKANRENALKMIRSIATEVFFDITQASDITYYLNPCEQALSNQIGMIDSEQQIIEAWKNWQVWQGANLGERSPNLAPIIINLEKLQENTSLKTFQVLTRLIDGKHSLRDIAIQKQTDVLLMTRSIAPYLQLKLLDLISISDLTIPLAIPTAKIATKDQLLQNSSSNITFQNNQNISIALVGHNQVVSQLMEEIVTTAGYSFICEHSPMSAIALFLERKPNLIFIDWNIPEINGYELCAQLRQLSCFQNVPIIVFCENVNLMDRVKAKMVGCSELYNQVLEAKSIIDLIKKHLTLATAMNFMS